METIYALRLVDEKWYIGKTKLPQSRITQHIAGVGSTWTQKYKPISLDNTWEAKSPFDEDNYTLQYMKKYGHNNVRGGCYTTMVLSWHEITHIQKQLEHASDVCFSCHEPGHFASECPKKEPVVQPKLIPSRPSMQLKPIRIFQRHRPTWRRNKGQIRTGRATLYPLSAAVPTWIHKPSPDKAKQIAALRQVCTSIKI